jgi:hypothetical protein
MIFGSVKVIVMIPNKQKLREVSDFHSGVSED